MGIRRITAQAVSSTELLVTIFARSYIADVFQRSQAKVWQVLCQGLTNATRVPTL